MNLAFYFQSGPVGDPNDGMAEAAELVRQLHGALDRLDQQQRKCIVVRPCSPSVEVRFEHCWEADQDDATAAEPVIELASLLINLENRSLSWNVAHEHDGQLGRIHDGSSVDELAAEVQTAIRIARALSDLIVDDEFVDADITLASSSSTFGDDADWSQAFVGEESFQRFPEWDQAE